jgi:hypothetical protein
MHQRAKRRFRLEKCIVHAFKLSLKRCEKFPRAEDETFIFENALAQQRVIVDGAADVKIQFKRAPP